MRGVQERRPRLGREQVEHVGDEHRVEFTGALGRERLDRARAQLDVRQAPDGSARPRDLALVRVDADDAAGWEADREQRDEHTVAAADV